ncbi:MAG: PKD domain-containing protein [Acidobacteria bacterium]|nr:PKD domain-containing protein [Acidobacteriota bacterium]
MVKKLRAVAVLVAITLGMSGAACSLDEANADPPLIGPSEFALSVTLSASPSQLPRDGSSQSVVTVTVRDASGRPVEGQRLSVSADIGTVSQTEVITGSDGRATFAFVAPDPSTGNNAATIRVVPIGGDGREAVVRTLAISLGGTSTTAPIASFTVSPSAPTLRENVVFDATASTDEGVQCLDVCTYSWDFGGEATRSGRIVTYQFQAVRTYAVTLTVTDGAGSIGVRTQNVVVAQGTAPTASFTFSPSSPGQFETVNFTAEASRVGQTGRTIVNHQWQFGDGTNATGLRVSHVYNVLGTYTVVLTVTDSAGVQGTSSQNVTVVNGVTAAFNFSPTDPTTAHDVVFNAEESRGSDDGFGSRNPITKYIWHFGIPGETSLVETSSPRILKRFPSPLTYRVTLTVEDSAGRRQTTNQTIQVK